MDAFLVHCALPPHAAAPRPRHCDASPAGLTPFALLGLVRENKKAYYAYADYDAFDYDAFFATDFDRDAALTTARLATPLPTLTSPTLGQIAFDAP